MKKICFVTTVSMTLKAFVLETAKYLHRYGNFDISFICNPDKEFEESLPNYIHFYPVSMERGISIAGIKAIVEIRKICKQQKFDLIQYSTANAACYTSIAAAMAGVPVRLYCQWGIAYVGFSGFGRKILKLIEKTVCNLSTWIEPDSYGNLNFSQEEGLYTANKSSVIWNGSAAGVDLCKFDINKKEEWRLLIRQKYGIPLDAVVFIFVGRITRDKGINELYYASQKIINKNNQVYFLMVGPDESNETVNQDMQAWAKEEKHMIFCGYTDEVEKYLAASDVYVLPSYREGFGSAVVEAEAMGVPVIVTNIPGPTDAMRKNETGLVVEKKNVEELVAAMELFYSDEDMRKRYGENACTFAHDCFDRQKIFEYILSDRKRLLYDKD